MVTLASVLLLTAVTMAQADQMSDVLKLPPHKHHVYIFDVTSEASVEDLKAALSNFTVQYAYKIAGESRFLFEVITNDTAALDALTFPEGTDVTQHPVFSIKEYAEMFAGTGKKWQKYETQLMPDNVFLFHEREEKIPETMCTKTFEMEAKEWGRFFSQPPYPLKTTMRPVLSSYPPRFFAFTYLEENEVQNIEKLSLDKAGGYGAMSFLTKRAVRI